VWNDVRISYVPVTNAEQGEVQFKIGQPIVFQPFDQASTYRTPKLA
jgi:hypothetical protein